jgi:hypothetical protein
VRCIASFTLTFSLSYIAGVCPYIAVGAGIYAGLHRIDFVLLFREQPMKKVFVLLILAAFAAPSLSFAAASYPNNKPRPPAHKKHKHHSKKAAPAPAAAQ